MVLEEQGPVIAPKTAQENNASSRYQPINLFYAIVDKKRKPSFSENLYEKNTYSFLCHLHFQNFFLISGALLREAG